MTHQTVLLTKMWAGLISVLILISLLSMSLSINTSSYAQERPVIRPLSNEEAEAVINDIKSKYGLTGPRGNYYLYLSGGLAKFKVSQVIPSLIGKKVDEIVLAYFDGKEWRVLPFRVYDRVAGPIYLLNNGTIGKDTVMEVRLPREYPIRANIKKDIPEFARGSLAYALRVRDKLGRTDGIIYVFVGGAVRYQMGSLRALINYEYPGAASPFSTSETPMVADLMRNVKYSEKEVAGMIQYVSTRDVATVEPLWEEPVPDGGGSGGGYDYNLVEARGFPTTELRNSSVYLSTAGDSYSFRYYIIDPYVSSVKWYTATIGIIAVPDQLKDTTGSLRVTASNPSCGISVSGDFTLYADKGNTIKLPITASAYGSTCEYVDVEIKLTNTGNTAWYITVRTAAYLKWEVSNSTLYAGYTWNIIQAFSGEESAQGGYPQQSKIMFTVSPTKKSDTKVFNLPLPSAMAVPEPLKTGKLRLLVSAPQGIDLGTEGPVSVTLSISGLSSCTVTFGPSTPPQECDLLVSRFTLAEHVVPLSTGELSVTLEAQGDLGSAKAVTLWISMLEPLKVPTRVMSQYEISGSIIDTSTYNLDSDAYTMDTYYAEGGLYSALQFSDDASYSKEQALIVALSRNPEKTNPYMGYAYVYYIVDIKGLKHEETLISDQNTYEYLTGVPPDAVDLSIQFSSTHSLGSAEAVARDFDLSGILPDLPEIPFLVSVAVSATHYGAAVVTAYDALKWTIDQINYATGASISVTVNSNAKTVNIHWERGPFSNKSPNGIVDINKVVTSAETPGWVTVRVNIKWGQHDDLTEFNLRG